VKTVGAAYFSEGVFARSHRGELFQRHTCLACGHHSPTWALFRLHRRTCVAQVGEPDDACADAWADGLLNEPGAAGG